MKIFGVHNFCTVESPARMSAINYSPREFFVRLIFVVLCNYKNFPMPKIFKIFTVYLKVRVHIHVHTVILEIFAIVNNSQLKETAKTKNAKI